MQTLKMNDLIKQLRECNLCNGPLIKPQTCSSPQCSTTICLLCAGGRISSCSKCGDALFEDRRMKEAVDFVIEELSFFQQFKNNGGNKLLLDFLRNNKDEPLSKTALEKINKMEALFQKIKEVPLIHEEKHQLRIVSIDLVDLQKENLFMFEELGVEINFLVENKVLQLTQEYHKKGAAIESNQNIQWDLKVELGTLIEKTGRLENMKPSSTFTLSFSPFKNAVLYSTPLANMYKSRGLLLFSYIRNLMRPASHIYLSLTLSSSIPSSSHLGPIEQQISKGLLEMQEMACLDELIDDNSIDIDCAGQGPIQWHDQVAQWEKDNRSTSECYQQIEWLKKIAMVLGFGFGIFCLSSFGRG